MLVLTSTHDGLVDTRCSERLAAAWQCEIARHPQAGHDLPLDDSAWVLAQIRRWLANQPITAPDR
jgi:predicted alpha/beta hydrolase family esterase